MSDKVIEEIKSKVDIVEIVGNYVKLKRSGTSYKGLCPFHQEKTPSFFVSPERQFFKCFGCGESGDVITFLMKIEGWSFYQTLKYLAKLTGVKLQKVTLDEDSQFKEQLYQLNRLAARFYHYLLLYHQQGEVGRHYLEERKINPEITKVFYLGTAPSGWRILTNFLKQKKENLDLAVKGGLIIKSEKGYYDRFRDRLIFPLFNILGEIVGFGGRRLHPNEEVPKYINTPETPIYNKSRHLFGLYQAKETIRQKKEVIVTEGEFDVLSSFQAGVQNIVAVKGSTLTEQHLKILRRYADQVIFSFDNDPAGIKATQKSFIMAENQGLKNKVIILRQGKDIDEVVKNSPQEWLNLIKQASYSFNFLLKYWRGKIKKDDPYSKNEIVKTVLELINQIKNPLLREEYLQFTARTLDIDEDILHRLQSQMNQVGPRRSIPETKTRDVPDYLDKLEGVILSLLIKGVERDYLSKKLTKEVFSHYGYRQLFTLLKKNNFDSRRCQATLKPELLNLYNELYLNPTAEKIIGMPVEKRSREVQKISQRLLQNRLKTKIETLKQSITEAEKKGEDISEKNKQLARYLHQLHQS